MATLLPAVQFKPHATNKGLPIEATDWQTITYCLKGLRESKVIILGAQIPRTLHQLETVGKTRAASTVARLYFVNFLKRLNQDKVQIPKDSICRFRPQQLHCHSQWAIETTSDDHFVGEGCFALREEISQKSSSDQSLENHNLDSGEQIEAADSQS